MYFVVFRDAELWHWSLHGTDHRKLSDSGPGFADQQACFRSVDAARRGLLDVAVVERIPAAPAAEVRRFASLVRGRA